MYISNRRYQTDPESANEVIRRVEDGFAHILSASPGFVNYYCFRNADGIINSISIFNTEQEAESSNRAAAQWVSKHLAELLPNPPEIVAGELGVRR